MRSLGPAVGELTADGSRLTPEACRVLRASPVQGPAGAPFRPGDRFRWTSGNGLAVRTGTILEWQPFIEGSSLARRSWGSWFVEVDPLPRPAGARERKRNPWDGFRTWFSGDELGVVERLP